MNLPRLLGAVIFNFMNLDQDHFKKSEPPHRSRPALSMKYTM